jgi:hypothetical protein
VSITATRTLNTNPETTNPRNISQDKTPKKQSKRITVKVSKN